MKHDEKTTLKTRILSFLWQHILLAGCLFLMTFGVALCVRSGLGSGVISSIPMVMSLAGADSLAPSLTIGQYTYIMNAVFVALQLLILRRRFQPVQLFQLIVGFIFGWFLDINMYISGFLPYHSLPWQILAQFAGCTVLAVGVSFEIRCGSVTMPGEGIQIALARVTGQPFPKMKVIVDTTLVVIATAIGYCYYGRWMWNVVGPGTLFAMFYVGTGVKFVNAHTPWFESVLHYVPGFRRYIYGLARFIYPKKQG